MWTARALTTKDASLHPRVPLVGGVHPWSRPPSLGQAGGGDGCRGWKEVGGGTERRRGRTRAEEGAVRWVEGRSPSSSACPSEPRCLPAPQGCAPGHLGVGSTLSLLELLYRGDRGQPRAGCALPPQSPPGHCVPTGEPRPFGGQGLLERPAVTPGPKSALRDPHHAHSWPLSNGQK